MTQKPIDVTSMDPTQTAQLDSMFSNIYAMSASIRYVSTTPTKDTVAQNEFVVFDDGAGTKRLYTITSQGNLGYVTLT